MTDADVGTETLTYEAAQGHAIAEEMRRDDTVFLMGQGIVGGGFFGGLKHLVDEFGTERIRDTGIEEAFMVGAAAGAAMAGARPVVQMGFADFALIAGDEIFQKLGKWRHMHGGKVTLPAVIIMPIGPSWGAGAEHSSSTEVLGMHFPGLKVVVPATPADAKGLLKTAIRDENPVLYYPDKTLSWVRGPVPTDSDLLVPFGQAAVLRAGRDLSIVCYGGMVAKALEAAESVSSDGIELEVVDLRTLVPLDVDTLVSSVKKTTRALVVHGACRSAGPGAEIAALIQERCFYSLDAPIGRLGGVDAPIPASKYLEGYCLPSVEDIVRESRRIVTE